MSSKKSKLDLLVRVRYANPLPPPPFPPKLLNIPTHPSRYARYGFASQLADETPFPMIVDADMGMAIDLSQYDGLWDYDADAGEDYDLNPDPNNLPELDPKDLFLVADMPSSFADSTQNASTSTNTADLNVSWLRKTEHVSSSSSAAIPMLREIRITEEPIPDVSHAAQISAIEESFNMSLKEGDLPSLRHPNKPSLRAVDSYEVFPDTRIWANAYDLVKFSERPGDRPTEEFDPRLETALIRPVKGEDGESYLSYYLTAEDAESISYKESRKGAFERAVRSRLTANPLLDSIEEDEVLPAGDSADFHFVRDYETVKIDMDVPNEFLLAFDDGSAAASGSGDNISSGKGAFYKNIERKYVLKKKRQNRQDDYADRWDVIHVTHEPLSDELWQEREEAVAEVQDPDFLVNAVAAQMEVDANGEGEGPRADTPNGDDWGAGESLAVHTNGDLDHVGVVQAV